MTLVLKLTLQLNLKTLFLVFLFANNPLTFSLTFYKNTDFTESKTFSCTILIFSVRTYCMLIMFLVLEKQTKIPALMEFHLGEAK